MAEHISDPLLPQIPRKSVCCTQPAEPVVQRHPYLPTVSSGGEGHRKGAAWAPSLLAHLSQGGGPRNPDRACESTGIESNPPTMMLTPKVLSLQASAEVGTIIPALLLEKGRTAFPRYSSSTPKQNSSISSICGTHNLLQPAKFSGEKILILYDLHSTFQIPKDSCVKRIQ